MRSLRRKDKKTREPQAIEFNVQELKRQILRDAKAVKMPAGAAEIVAEKVATEVAKWVEKRAVVTTDDINRRVYTEMLKYNSDLAYVYQIRGKII